MRTHAAVLSLCLTATLCGTSVRAWAQETTSPSTPPPASPETPAATPKAGKKDKKKKEKEEEEKPFSMNVDTGTLTVDGMIAKARLNYEVKANYLYFYIPDVGAVIVSLRKFGDATLQKDAFQKQSLKISAGDHTLELSTQAPLIRKPHDAWVKLDPTYRDAKSPFPEMGFGDTLSAPYKWPGAKPAAEVERGSFTAPPVPKDLQPKVQETTEYSVKVKPAPAK